MQVTSRSGEDECIRAGSYQLVFLGPEALTVMIGPDMGHLFAPWP